MRPDGLLLARGPAEEHLPLPAHVLAGGSVVPPPAEATGTDLTAEQLHRETAWLALSEGIDSVRADDREQFLARLALLLGDRVGTADFQEAVSVAASVH